MAKNNNLHKAKNAKNDEFYTMFDDVEREIPHYFKELKDKDLTILCNCDDPFESNFFKYLTLHFHHLGIKRLIGISYAGSPIAGETMREIYGDKFDIDTINHGFVVDVNKYVWTPERGFSWNIALEQIRDFPENKIVELEGDGSFQCGESIEYLKQADIVITTPPHLVSSGNMLRN